MDQSTLCPLCGHVKSPLAPYCGACAVVKKTEYSAKAEAWIERRSTPTLILILVVYNMFRFARTLACAGISIGYIMHGQRDIAILWLMLAVMCIPSRESK